MEITIIFKIVAVGIIVAVMNQLLQKEYTLLTTIAGLIIVLLMFVPALEELKDVLSSVVQF